jgi:hypothetical protein
MVIHIWPPFELARLAAKFAGCRDETAVWQFLLLNELID